MRPYLDIARWKNLLFLALIQWLMQFSVVNPLLLTFGFEADTHNTLFWLLVLSTLLIMAGGNVINDYFDVKIDRLNRPDHVIVGEKITNRQAMLFYQLLTTSGIILGLIIAYLTRSFTLGFIFILTPGLLWFYSASYKRQFIVGNLLVSLLSALSIFIVGLLAVAQLKLNFGVLLFETPLPKTIYGWLGGFAGFAFLLTWIREIIKDMEDIEGDRELECRTMSIKWGLNKTKLVVYLLVFITLILLFFVNYRYISFENNFTLRYIIIGLCIPLLALCFLIYRAKDTAGFHQASTLTKYIMLIGVLYSLVFYYLLAAKFDIPLFGLFLVK